MVYAYGPISISYGISTDEPSRIFFIVEPARTIDLLHDNSKLHICRNLFATTLKNKLLDLEPSFFFITFAYENVTSLRKRMRSRFVEGEAARKGEY